MDRSARRTPTIIIERGAVMLPVYTTICCSSLTASMLNTLICGTQKSKIPTAQPMVQGFKNAFFSEICFLSCVIRYAPTVHKIRLKVTVKIIKYIMASELPSVNMSINGMPTNAQLEKVPAKINRLRCVFSCGFFINKNTR